MLIIKVSGVDQTMNNKSAYSSHVWSFWYDSNWFFWSVDFQSEEVMSFELELELNGMFTIS